MTQPVYPSEYRAITSPVEYLKPEASGVCVGTGVDVGVDTVVGELVAARASIFSWNSSWVNTSCLVVDDVQPTLQVREISNTTKRIGNNLRISTDMNEIIYITFQLNLLN